MAQTQRDAVGLGIHSREQIRPAELRKHMNLRAAPVLQSLAAVASQPPEASMRSVRLHRPWLSVILVLAIMRMLSLTGSAQSEASHAKKPKSGSCTHDDSGLKLPAGFCATVFAEGIGHARHLVVSPSGVVLSTPGPETTMTSTKHMMGVFWSRSRTR